MSNDKVVSLAAPVEVSDPLTDLLRSDARRLIEAAVTAEFEEHLGAFEDQQLSDGRRRVVRNGHLPERAPPRRRWPWRAWWGRGSGARAVGERGEPSQAGVGRGVPAVVPAPPRGRLGVRLGGRYSQRPAR